MNPLIARAVKWMDRPFRSAMISAAIILASVIVVTPMAYADPDSYVLWITLLGAIIVLTPTFFAVTAAHFTERTIHEGFYDMVVMSMTDREIVLGHVLLTFLHLRNVTAGILSLLLVMVVLVPLYVINQINFDDVGLQTMIASLPLIVGAGGLYLLASVVGVSVSLRWGNQIVVFGLAVVGYLLLSLLCVWLGLTSFGRVALQESPTDHAPFGLVVGSFYLIILMLTWGYEHTVTNSIRILAAFVSMTLMVLFIGDGRLLGFVVGFMVLSGYLLFMMDLDPSDGIAPRNRPISMLPQFGVVTIIVILLFTQLLDIDAHDYALSVLGLTLDMLLPYVLAVGLMSIAENWTERPIAQYYNNT